MTHKIVPSILHPEKKILINQWYIQMIRKASWASNRGFSSNTPASAASETSALTNTRAAWIAALVLSAVIAVLHIVFAMNAGPLWRDEAAHISFATMSSWTEIWQYLHLDNFPPFLLVVLRTWTSLCQGTGDNVYRVLGCLIGLGLLAMLWLVPRQFGKRPPLMGLVLFGLAPYALWFGDSIRPYGLGICFVLFAFGAFWRLVKTGSLLDFGLAAMAALLSVQTLYQNSTLILAFGIAGVSVCLRRGRKKTAFLIFAAGVLAAVSLFPYLPLIREANAWSFVSRSGLGPDRVIKVVKRALSAAGDFSVLVWVLLVLGALIFAVSRQIPNRKDHEFSKDSDPALYAGISCVLSIMFFMMLLFYIGMPTQPWYYLIPMALTAVALDALLIVFLENRPPIAGWIIIGISIVTAIASVPSTWAIAHIRQSNIDIIAELLETRAGKDDLILVNPWMNGITFQRYFHKPVEWVTIPPMADHRIHRYDVLKQQMENPDPLAPVLSRMADTLKSGHRVWIIGNIMELSNGHAPVALPPAPNSPSGWSERDYRQSWSMQIGHFLIIHAKRGQRIDIPVTREINPFETADLLQIEGWVEASHAR